MVVATTHTNKQGHSKIKQSCTLPLTGRSVADMIITELAVFRVTRGKGMILVEHAPGITVEEIREKTDATFEVSNELTVMKQ